MIGDDDHAILIDFGTSKQYDEAEGENTSTLMGKTPGFAPPEQMGNDVVKFTPATDIYSLGATLYKLLTGITPLSAAQLISGEELEPMPKAVSERTRKAVEQAMLLNKNKRPQTIAEFMTLLQPGRATTVAVDTTEINHIEEATQLEAEEETVYEAKRMINGHEYVDLGLPSGLKWATCNVGANAPHEYGGYYAWGETATKGKYTQENNVTFGQKISDISSNAQYDTARANWGGSWRMPTEDEIEELVDECAWKWTTQRGVKGYKVTGPNGNSIFLPAAGYCGGSSRYYVGECGYYWSSTPYESNTYDACRLSFDSGLHNVSWCNRDGGRTVRPVSE